MRVGIVGLGLIGGSAAKAYKAAGNIVYACDINCSIVEYALLEGVLDGMLDDEALALCDILLLTATPRAVIGYLRENADKFSRNTLVMDFCGTKRLVCDEGFALSKKYGFTFIGAHPMAGLQYSGYKYSRGNLFNGASLIIVPPVHDDISLLDEAKRMLQPLGFKKFVVTDAAHHDSMIAYTSQMCHIVSNAFVKSPSALSHRGYSAGSFRDLTRVARLNEAMWTELCLENSENVLKELDCIMKSLGEFRDAIAQGDAGQLYNLFKEGCKAKAKTDL